MNIALKARMYYPLLAILLVGLLCACASPAAAPAPPPNEPSEPTGTTPDESPTTDGSSGATGRVDVVYFHPHRRCGPCLYIEMRARYNIETHFQDAVASGKLTFQIYDLGDKENAAIANKYGAVGPQLFINTIRDGVDHIEHIQDVWMPKYLNDQEAFDELIQSLIEQSLKGEE